MNVIFELCADVQKQINGKGINNFGMRIVSAFLLIIGFNYTPNAFFLVLTKNVQEWSWKTFRFLFGTEGAAEVYSKI